MKNDKQDLYKLLADGYYGCGGFLDGAYLEKHPREGIEKYNMRRRLAYYLNYLAPCVNAHVSPVFKTLPVREWSGAGEKIWKTFTEDVDFLGTGISDLMKQAALSAKLHGVSYIVMDKVEGAAEDLRMADLEENRRQLPYAYVLDINATREIVVDNFGHITKIVFAEPDAYVENSQALRTMTIEGWTLEDSKGKHTGTWALGCVPVVPLFSKAARNHCPFPPSEFLSIAKTNLAIYNLCSWLNDILVNQTFSVLTYPSSNPESIVLGTNNALSYPPDSSHAPQFIAPPADPANVLVNQIATLQQEIYRMAVVVNVTGSNKQQSGEAKAWDYEATNQNLSDFADAVERTENRLADLFKAWTGIDFEYSVNYPNDFKISEVEQELSNAEIAKALGFGDDFDVEVFKRVLTSYLPELKADDFDRLVESYKVQQQQERLDMNNVGNSEDVDNAGDEGQQGAE